MKRESFHIPEGIIYLDGNSLGPMPKSALSRMTTTLNDEWGEMLIKGWNQAGWYQQPRAIGDQIAPLIGAAQGSVVIGDTLSIKVFQALSAALKMRPDRKVILSDNGNFPTDLYMAEGLIGATGQHELKIVAPEEVEQHLDDTVAVMMLTQVDYRTGRMHDMAKLTQKAHESGIIALWDLAHSAGAVPVDLAGCHPEFAVGCTYKYLNAGPGAPAFIYIRPDLADTAAPILAGWMGHQAPFAFALDYTPAPGIERMRVGTPPVLQMAVLEEALKVWQGVAMSDIRAKSIALSELFIDEVEARCPQLRLISPRNSAERGSQVSFSHPEGYAIIQALIDRGVIGDFRAPDVLRFGFTPLYLDTDDIRKAVDTLHQVMRNRLWDRPEYKQKAAVT